MNTQKYETYKSIHESLSKALKYVSAKYCYVTRKLRLHQNDRCKRFTLFVSR